MKNLILLSVIALLFFSSCYNGEYAIEDQSESFTYFTKEYENPKVLNYMEIPVFQTPFWFLNQQDFYYSTNFNAENNQ